MGCGRPARVSVACSTLLFCGLVEDHLFRTSRRRRFWVMGGRTSGVVHSVVRLHNGRLLGWPTLPERQRPTWWIKWIGKYTDGQLCLSQRSDEICWPWRWRAGPASQQGRRSKIQTFRDDNKGEKSQRRAELCDWIGVASSPSLQSKCLSIDNGRECVCVCVWCSCAPSSISQALRIDLIFGHSRRPGPT